MKKYLFLFINEIKRSIKMCFKLYILIILILVVYVTYKSYGESNVAKVITNFFWGNNEQEFHMNGKLIKLPSEWIIILGLYYFSVGVYIAKDKVIMIDNISVKMNSFFLWWILKCGWVLVYSVISYMIFISVICINVVLSKGSSELFLSLNTAQNIELLWIFVITPLTCYVIACMQLLMEMVGGIVFGTSVVFTYLVSTAYIRSPFLMGNYLMYQRTQLYMPESRINIGNWMVCSSSLYLLTVICGCIYMRKKYNR